jgi:uncharacterized protein YbaR (Trm112 family)
VHLLVTDRMCCPRCGPGFGLILIADRLVARRVFEGSLGCPNCRDRYPVEAGFGDLRPSPRLPVPERLDGFDDPAEALKLAALAGVREGPGFLLLAGDAVRHAPRIAAIVPGIEVVVMHPGVRGWPESEGVTRIQVGDRLPFETGSLRGVILDGADATDRFDEAVRVLEGGARLVLRSAVKGGVDRMEGAGLDLLLESDSILVGVLK